MVATKHGELPSQHVTYEIRWKNFRGFRDTGWLRVRPLTVLIGPNNSGKTSLIAPLLLLNQTVVSRDTTAPLVLRGPLYDCGTFRDVIRGHQKRRNIFMGIRFHVHARPTKIGQTGSYPPGGVELTFGMDRRRKEMVLKRYAVCDIFRRPYLSRTRRPSGRYSLEGADLRQLRPAERRIVEEQRPVTCLFSPAQLLSARLSVGAPDVAVALEAVSRPFTDYLSVISYVFTELIAFFNRLTYIGPLRDRPRRHYEITGGVPPTVGGRGQRAPNLLRSRLKTMSKSVDRWIAAFELGDAVDFDDLSDDVFSMNLVRRRPLFLTNIADVGFGASQVFPLIVQALAAPPGSLTIAEQPEIHLNPRLQGVLADLFVNMAKRRRQVILETHSEHLLLRLRRHIAAGRIESQQVAVYFVEQRGGESTVREVSISPNGHIRPEDWPRGFFEDSLGESLALASAQAKSR